MQLLNIGLNYQSAPLELRERVAFNGPALDDALVALKGRFKEGFILSTCNRTEIYALVGHADTGADLLCKLLSELTDVSIEELAPHLYIKSHTEAVEHLFMVASGLQSMVPGEDQIMAQIKEALSRADASEVLGPVMHRLGDSALSAGKRVRSGTDVGRHSLSVVSVALQLASERLDSLVNKRVVLMGAGQTAELALKHLSGVARSVTIINRSVERGAELASRFSCHATTRENLSAQLAEADLVISCTSSPAYVISKEDVVESTRLRSVDRKDDAPLILFDLAVPRDIDPKSAEISNVLVWDIDRLQKICAENRELRIAEIEKGEKLVAEDAERFMGWWRSRQVIPTIQALLSQAETVQNVELSRALSRLSIESDRDKELIKSLVSRVVSKLLHRPITLLKEDPEGGNMALVMQHLFGLNHCPVTQVGSVDRVPSPHSSLQALPSSSTSQVPDLNKSQ